MDSGPPQTNQFYVLRGQSTEGPLAKEVLFPMRKDGLISDDTLICRVGDSQWTPMGVLFPSTKHAPRPRLLLRSRLHLWQQLRLLLPLETVLLRQ